MVEEGFMYVQAVQTRSSSSGYAYTMYYVGNFNFRNFSMHNISVKLKSRSCAGKRNGLYENNGNKNYEK